ncbi:MAG: bis-aminopropyl spermidine synthase family protein [Candidatus Hadarchaeum sp.]
MKKVEEYVLCQLTSGVDSFWGLCERSPFPLSEIIRTIDSLKRNGYISINGAGIKPNKKGIKAIDCGSGVRAGEICHCCDGKGVVVGEKFQKIIADFREIVKDRPVPSLKFFQGYMREEDVIVRAALMHRHGDLRSREIVLMGDDDLLSVALSLTKMPARICVLDADERLEEFLKAVNREHGFEIEFIKYNVEDPLPKKMIGAFDVFSSEPLESISGLKAFVVRGVSCLKENGVGYFGLTTLEASRSKWLQIEKLLGKMNCVITDIIRDFSRYPMKYDAVDYEIFAKELPFPVGPNPGIDWYRSTLFRFEVVSRPRPCISPYQRFRIKSVDEEEDLTHPMGFKTIRKLSQPERGT